MKHKIFITHFRRFEEIPFFMTKWDGQLDGLTLEHRGGITEAVVLDEKGEILSVGQAYCSDRDNYSKKIGRNIATGRALKSLARSS